MLPARKNPAQRKAPTWSGSDVLLRRVERQTDSEKGTERSAPRPPSSITRSPDRDRAVRAVAGEGKLTTSCCWQPYAATKGGGNEVETAQLLQQRAAQPGAVGKGSGPPETQPRGYVSCWQQRDANKEVRGAGAEESCGTRTQEKRWGSSSSSAGSHLRHTASSEGRLGGPGRSRAQPAEREQGEQRGAIPQTRNSWKPPRTPPHPRGIEGGARCRPWRRGFREWRRGFGKGRGHAPGGGGATRTRALCSHVCLVRAKCWLLHKVPYRSPASVHRD